MELCGFSDGDFSPECTLIAGHEGIHCYPKPGEKKVIKNGPNRTEPIWPV